MEGTRAAQRGWVWDGADGHRTEGMGGGQRWPLRDEGDGCRMEGTGVRWRVLVWE